MLSLNRTNIKLADALVLALFPFIIFAVDSSKSAYADFSHIICVAKAESLHLIRENMHLKYNIRSGDWNCTGNAKERNLVVPIEHANSQLSLRKNGYERFASYVVKLCDSVNDLKKSDTGLRYLLFNEHSNSSTKKEILKIQCDNKRGEISIRQIMADRFIDTGSIEFIPHARETIITMTQLTQSSSPISSLPVTSIPVTKPSKKTKVKTQNIGDSALTKISNIKQPLKELVSSLRINNDNDLPLHLWLEAVLYAANKEIVQLRKNQQLPGQNTAIVIQPPVSTQKRNIDTRHKLVKTPRTSGLQCTAGPSKLKIINKKDIVLELDFVAIDGVSAFDYGLTDDDYNTLYLEGQKQEDKLLLPKLIRSVFNYRKNIAPFSLSTKALNEEQQKNLIDIGVNIAGKDGISYKDAVTVVKFINKTCRQSTDYFVRMPHEWEIAYLMSKEYIIDKKSPQFKTCFSFPSVNKSSGKPYQSFVGKGWVLTDRCLKDVPAETKDGKWCSDNGVVIKGGVSESNLLECLPQYRGVIKNTVTRTENLLRPILLMEASNGASKKKQKKQFNPSPNK